MAAALAAEAAATESMAHRTIAVVVVELDDDAAAGACFVVECLEEIQAPIDALSFYNLYASYGSPVLS